jgi:hypothetical protein
MDHDDIGRLVEIREEMMDLLYEAKGLLNGAPRDIKERAKAYWIGHIDVALGDGEYVDNHDYTMQRTIGELEDRIPLNEEDEELDDEEISDEDDCSLGGG